MCIMYIYIKLPDGTVPFFLPSQPYRSWHWIHGNDEKRSAGTVRDIPVTDFNENFTAVFLLLEKRPGPGVFIRFQPL